MISTLELHGMAHFPSQDELLASLHASQEAIDGLISRLISENVDLAELVGQLESLSVRDQERARLLETIRLEASESRRREEDRPLRQFVLLALEEIGVPQTAGFL